MRPIALVFLVLLGGFVGVRAAQAQSDAGDTAQELLRRAVQIEITAAASPNDPHVQAVAAAMAKDLRARAQLLVQIENMRLQNQLMRDELARRQPQCSKAFRDCPD